jgi:SAM-dependent methyltransferase/uncharacterized membrane protein YbhN (UPF0104 family)
VAAFWRRVTALSGGGARHPGWVGWVAVTSLVLGLGTSAFWLAREDLATLAITVRETAWWMTPFVALATVSSIAIRFVRWQYLLRVSGLLVPTRDSATVYAGGLAMILTPAYAGEVVRSFLLRHWHGMPLRRTLPVVIAERIHDMAALVAIDVVLSLGAAPLLDSVWAGAVVAAGLGLASFTGRLASPARSGADRGPRPAPMLRLRVLVIAFALSLIAWGVAGAGFFIAAAATGARVSVLPAVRVFVSGTIAGAISLLPAGVGVSGSAMIVGLVREDTPVQTAVLTVLVARLLTVWLAVAIGTVVLMRLARHWAGRTRAIRRSHFDELAPDYTEEVPRHIRDHVLAKKLRAMAVVLEQTDCLTGADLGCGQGWYATELVKRTAHRVVAIDLSAGQLDRAATAGGAPGLLLVTGDVARLPIQEASLDFAFSINTFHHLADRSLQIGALAEVARVLKPGARFFLHEMNVRNPLFRFYLGYVYPIVKRIDEGTELWLPVDRLPVPPALALEGVEYFTFLPDFLPEGLLRLLRPVESWLEASSARGLSAHYVACFRKAPEPATLAHRSISDRAC